MNVILYCPKECKYGKDFPGLISSLEAVSEITIEEEIASLVNRIAHQAYSGTVVILFVPSENHLENLLKVKEVFEDHRLIMFLPTENKHMISDSHKLYPRFIGIAKYDMQNAVSVLERLLVHASQPIQS